jgi:hypothetical protein
MDDISLFVFWGTFKSRVQNIKCRYVRRCFYRPSSTDAPDGLRHAWHKWTFNRSATDQRFTQRHCGTENQARDGLTWKRWAFHE